MHLEVAEAAYLRWSHQYGALKAHDAKRLNTLENESIRLNHLVAGQALDIDLLKGIKRGNF